MMVALPWRCHSPNQLQPYTRSSRWSTSERRSSWIGSKSSSGGTSSWKWPSRYFNTRAACLGSLDSMVRTFQFVLSRLPKIVGASLRFFFRSESDTLICVTPFVPQLHCPIRMGEILTGQLLFTPRTSRRAQNMSILLGRPLLALSTNPKRGEPCDSHIASSILFIRPRY